MKRKGTNAAAWFATQSFHDLPAEPPTRDPAAHFRAFRSAPRCERCGQPEEDWPDFSLNEADICSVCTMAEGMQHHAPYHLRDRWHAAGGHCRCEDCAPPRAVVEAREREQRVRTLATMEVWHERVLSGTWTHTQYVRAVVDRVQADREDGR